MSEQPSIRAESTIDSGMVTKKFRSRYTLKGSMSPA